MAWQTGELMRRGGWEVPISRGREGPALLVVRECVIGHNGEVVVRTISSIHKVVSWVVSPSPKVGVDRDRGIAQQENSRVD